MDTLREFRILLSTDVEDGRIDLLLGIQI